MCIVRPDPTVRYLSEPYARAFHCCFHVELFFCYVKGRFAVLHQFAVLHLNMRRMENGAYQRTSSTARSVARPQLRYKDVCKRDLKALDSRWRSTYQTLNAGDPEAAKPVPIFKGHFGGKGYPLLGVFIQENDVFVYFSDEMGENI